MDVATFPVFDTTVEQLERLLFGQGHPYSHLPSNLLRSIQTRSP